MVSACGKMTVLINPHFFYQSRRLLDVPQQVTQQVTQLLVEGAYISTANIGYSHLLNDLRGTLAETSKAAGIFTSVQDIDFARVLYVKMAPPPAPPPSYAPPSYAPPNDVRDHVPVDTTMVVFIVVMLVVASLAALAASRRLSWQILP